MTATEELRQMLDERGVKWWKASPCKTKWHSPVLGGPVAVREWNGKMVLDAGYESVTPAQAIDATLGRGTCRLIKHGNLTDWPEMVCWSCSECNFGWHHSVHDKQFTYCPNCGRKVVDA